MIITQRQIRRIKQRVSQPIAKVAIRKVLGSLQLLIMTANIFQSTPALMPADGLYVPIVIPIPQTLLSFPASIVTNTARQIPILITKM
ncbi:MAG: hypothetical protein M1470_02245 [Bacteroidetes bacterium]|nr:hypothetical protein [Bacteroidota bacterium]MCL5737896.1 hypothetical protein [Bacteroidota bacterium]